MSNDFDLNAAQWRKSSFSGGSNGDCIEVADGLSGLAPVRDSKDPSGPTLMFSKEAFADFVTAVAAGQFPTG